MSHPSSAGFVANRQAPDAANHGTAPAQRPPWTFLTNHSHVLLTINGNPNALVEEIAATVGIIARATLHILADLEDAGYLQRLQEIGALLAIFAPTDGHSRKELS
ncbi:MarR family transcriptional regulator [Arthrobacter sp. TMN-50]